MSSSSSSSDMGKSSKNNKKKGEKNGTKLPNLKPGSYHFYGNGVGSGSTTVNNNKHHKSLNATDDDSLEELFKPGQQIPTVEAYSLRLGHQRMNAAYDKFLGENNVKAGIDLFARVKDEGFMEAVTWSSCYVIRASLTLEKVDIDMARECVHHASKMCKKLMKSSFFENISKLVVTPNYDKYTDVEVFAQLYYAKQFALRIALDAMETNSVFTLIKLAYYLRGLVRTYNECWQIKKKRTAWESEEAREYFNAHARFANGIINLVISHTPPKFLRIMNFLGYQGTESVGLNELNRVAFEMAAGFTSKMAQLLLIYYWVYAKPHGENIPDDLSLCKQLVEAELKLFPQSMLYGLAKAKIAQINGNFDEAIVTLNKLLKAPHLASAYKAFYFELIWCHAINLDWDACIECSERIRSSKHSPVCTAFLNAVFRYVKGLETGDQELLDQATKEFEVIPSLRIRHFGKTMTTEKAALTTSILYFKKGKKLVLPVMAMLYSGNYLMFIRSEAQLEKLMKRVESQVQLYLADYESDSACLDDYLVAIFYKAVLLRLMKKYAEAQECHETIFREKDRIDLETSIMPMSTMELGLIEMEKGNFDEAKRLLESAEKDFSGYLAENFVHLKVYAAYRRMGHSTDKQQEDKEKLNKHILNWLKYHEIDLKAYREIISTTTK